VVHPRRSPHEAEPSAIAAAAQEEDAGSQGEMPWPLVRREPQTAQAETADIVGTLAVFDLV